MATKLKLGTNNNWATKEGKLLGYNDENNNFKPIPFDVTSDADATRINKNGLVERTKTNVPRVSFNGADNPHLLLEPSRANLLQRSEEFDNTYYTKFDTSITPNVITSPDGSLNADEITKEGDYGSISKTAITISSGSNYTLSVFVKKGTTNFFSLRQASGSYDVRKQFNLITKEVTDAPFVNQTGFISSKIEDYSDNWYRLSIICTSNSTSLDVSFYSGKVAESTFNGDSYIWGAQLEEGTYPTSYIPTIGSAATRTVDKCLNAGSSNLFNDTEGTLFLDIYDFKSSVNPEITLSSGSASNRITLVYYPSSNQLRFFISSNNVVQADQFVSYTYSQRNKIALRYKQNDFKAYINGTQVFSDTSGNTPVGLSRFDFSKYDQSNGFVEGEINQAMVFNEALSDSELQTLTS